MSDLPADDDERLTLVARIERQQAKTGTFVAEQNRLSAEAAKFHRDRFLAPILAVVATLGPIAALTPSIVRATGGIR